MTKRPFRETCKGCKGEMRVPEARNALSRYGHGHICSNCGLKEAFLGDFIKTKTSKKKNDKK